MSTAMTAQVVVDDFPEERQCSCGGLTIPPSPGPQARGAQTDCYTTHENAHSGPVEAELQMRTSASCRSSSNTNMGELSEAYCQNRLSQSFGGLFSPWPHASDRMCWFLSHAYVLMVVLCLVSLPSTLAFNVDLETRVIHTGANGSMFGYSVAQHIDQATNWLLVGAPKAQTREPEVIEGGAVFRCKTKRAGDGRCHAVKFDEQQGNKYEVHNKTGEFRSIEEKSHQWLGATVRSSGENGVIVACAPRYVYFSKKMDKREPVGMCFVAKPSTQKPDIYSPCKEGVDDNIQFTDQFNKQGFCQFGMTAAFNHDGRRLLIGAPGSYYWQGTMYNYNTVSKTMIGSTKEGNATDDNNYRGFSSAIGDFDGDEKDDYVVGVPKGANYLGKVEMYSQNLTLLGSLEGEQIGAYFGYTLTVSDLNGDRLDDIVVGAPFHAEFKDSDSYDIGRVYIFYQTLSRTFKSQKRDILEGSGSGSRFGLSLSGLGDINYDGYDDLCVGSPYAGENKKGAVYIYHGSKKGIITEASQIIYAKDVTPSLRTFGYSLSGGMDQDSNLYPDMLVGAYESDKAVFLRTRPVVRVYAILKLEPGLINLDNQDCNLVDDTRAPCLSVYTCIKYTGIAVPETLDFDITWVLDAKDNSSRNQRHRAFYLNNKYTETKKHTLQRKKRHCTNSYAYVEADPIDKLTPIRATLEFKLHEKGNKKNNKKRRSLTPILDAYIPTTTSFTAQILKDCGLDNICHPDLRVQAIRISTSHIIGNLATLELLVIVQNNGEDSFNTVLYIDLPPGVKLYSISDEKSVVSINCDPHKTNPRLVLCQLGNPMKKNAEAQFTLNLRPTNTNDTKNSLVFTLFANSSNPELQTKVEDNVASVEIPVTVDADIVLYGKASPELIRLNTTDPKTEDKGRSVTHLFQLRNQGQSAINQTRLQILWPSHDTNGNPLLVMDGPPVIEGQGKCQVLVVNNNLTDYSGPNGSSASMILKEAQYSGKQDTKSFKITCSERYCTIIQCLVGYMDHRSNFVITIKSKLKARGFIKRRLQTKMYHIISVAHAIVRSVPYDFEVDSTEFERNQKRIEVVTKVNTDRLRPPRKGVKAWVIAVAIIAGLLFLLLLILLLCLCGFFKRKKPEEDGYFVVNGKTDIDHKIFE